MKRLISGAEAVQAGLVYGGAVWGGPWTRWRAVPAIEGFANSDAFRLWRSLPGYRKACRMLRRSGRKIRTGPEMGVQAYQSVLEDPAAVEFAAQSVYGLPSYMGIERASCPLWRADTRESTVDSIIQDIERFARKLCGPVPEPFVPTRGVYIDTTQMRPKAQEEP